MSTLLPRSPSSDRGDPARGRARRRRRVRVAAGIGVIAALLAVGVALRGPGSGPLPLPPLPDAVAQAGRTIDRVDGGAVAAPTPQVVGYLPYWEQPAAVRDALRASDLLTTAAPWWYAPTSDGAVVEQHPRYTDTGEDVVAMLRGGGLTVMPTIANHRDGEWDFEIVPRIIADPDVRAAHVGNLVALVEDRDFDGIVIDYELLGADDRDNFSAFVTELGAELHARDRRLAVALHAQASDEGSGGHNRAQDYRSIGQAVDEVHLMTYDLHYDESDPGPVAPLPWVTDVLDYAVERVPPDKLLLGIGLFGYDWGDDARADGVQLPQVAERMALNTGEHGWDEEARSPWFRYEAGDEQRIVWYEDARSVEAKLDLVARYQLGGAFLWRLGGVPDDIWHAAGRTLAPDR